MILKCNILWQTALYEDRCIVPAYVMYRIFAGILIAGRYHAKNLPQDRMILPIVSYAIMLCRMVSYSWLLFISYLLDSSRYPCACLIIRKEVKFVRSSLMKRHQMRCDVVSCCVMSCHSVISNVFMCFYDFFMPSFVMYFISLFASLFVASPCTFIFFFVWCLMCKVLIVTYGLIYLTSH